jgi:aminobenzoyl-glutamate utilization protein B
MKSAVQSVTIALCLLSLPAVAADRRAAVTGRVEAHAARFGEVSRLLWEYAEPGYQETRSAALLKEELRKEGFRIRDAVGDIPTAFVAEWGSGKPVIGFMGEYDALPGLSQEAVPLKKAREGNTYGQGCGHNLLGAGSALAAVAVKETLESEKLPGTVRFYGTPAEEGGGGKVYMIRAGVFADADAILHWHPEDRSIATDTSTLAIISARFRFEGRPAHAAAAPEKGRSALDAAMLMAHAVEMLREHVPSSTRIHYIISNGGDAPNIVPAAAEISLYARHPEMSELDGIWQRIVKCAEAGALATETRMSQIIVNSDYDVLPNDALTRTLFRNLNYVGGVRYTPDEQQFAEAIRKTLAETGLPLGSQEQIRPLNEYLSIASTDAGDVSWVVPTGWIHAATHVPGVVNHSWQATACAGSSIGRKGMVLAAKTLALTGVELLTDPAQLKAARDSFEQRRAGRTYQSRLPADARPPLDYRK